MSLGLGIISGALGVAGGIAGKISHDKYAKFLDNLQLDVPDAVYQAEGVYNELASQGLQGKDVIASDIEGTMSSNINTAKEVVDSPSALIDLLAKSSGDVSKQMRQLGVQDSQVQQQNKAMLGNFLANTKAPIELNINQLNMERKIAAQRERMVGTSELFGGLTQGLTGFTSGYAAFQQNKGMNNLNENLKSFFNVDQNGGGGNNGNFLDSNINQYYNNSSTFDELYS